MESSDKEECANGKYVNSEFLISELLTMEFKLNNDLCHRKLIVCILCYPVVLKHHQII